MSKFPIPELFRQIWFAFFLFFGPATSACLAQGNAVPHSRTYPESKAEVGTALTEMQAYALQKLPTIDGFIAVSDAPSERYERPFYRFSIELLPARSNGTTVRAAAVITAWYADPNAATSGYRVLPSNGHLEADLLDRLADKLERRSAGTNAGMPAVQSPKHPAVASRILVPAITAPSLRRFSVAAPQPSGGSTGDATGDEMDALRTEREAREKRIQDLNAVLQNLQELRNNQALPENLAIVKRDGTPVLAKPAQGSRVLFVAAERDEFERIEAVGDWVHIRISGLSQGYIRRSQLHIPEDSSNQPKPDLAVPASSAPMFHVEHEETATFPGDWDPLRGKPVRIYTVQPAAPFAGETSTQAKFEYVLSLFRKFSAEFGSGPLPVEGVVVIFDSADGGIVGSTTYNLRQMAAGSLSVKDFRKSCFVDLPGTVGQP